ncbi:hypothetical protein ACFLT7_02875 [candidate division KSB1 bacterium]
MNKLNWNIITNGNDFQRLVNDLFAFEISNPAFLLSNPEIGADGGWDGRYNGTYLGLNGLWSFQHKYTKHNLNDAYAHLRREIISELKKAKSNGVQYLLICTNADLRVGDKDHIGKLECLNYDGEFVNKLFIWPKLNLESKINNHLFLKHIYFGDPQEPMFVPPHIYANSEPLLNMTLIGRENSLKYLRDFVNDINSNVLLVYAGGGYGKTHFIVEAAKELAYPNTGMQVWFCRPGIRDVNEAINEFNHKNNSIVLLDDAERYLEETKKLLAHTKSYSPGKLKLILSFRSSGTEIINNLINFHRIHNYRMYELPKLDEDSLIKILNYAAKPNIINHPDRIVKQLNGNLFLLVSVGKIIRGGELDPTYIKEQITINLNHDATVALEELLNNRNTKRLLRELSIIVPFYRDSNNDILNRLSTILKLDVDLLNESISKLIDVEILRLVGTSIRFNPDMKGDIYLSVELDRENGKDIANELFENWLSVRPKQLIANIADASRHSEKKAVNEVVKHLIHRWIAEATAYSDSRITIRLEHLSPISFLAPSETISLISAYINSRDCSNILGFSDKCGEIIFNIMNIPNLEDNVINLIRGLAQANLNNRYDNYTATSLIKHAVSPIKVSINSANKSLSILFSWLDSDDCTETEAHLISNAVKEALLGSHEQIDSYGNTITIGRMTLRYESNLKKEIDNFRDQAMKTLEKLIFHSNDMIKVFGIDVVNHIGDESGSCSNELIKRIISDKNKAIEWLTVLAKSNVSNVILSSIEDVLIRYWINNNIHSDLSARTADVLRSYPRTGEYLIFRYFVSDNIIISDFSAIENVAPINNKWPWLLKNYSRHSTSVWNSFIPIVKRLAQKYLNSTDIIKYLNELEYEIRGYNTWQYVALIENWFSFNEHPFIEIISDAALLAIIPERFRLGIYRIASDVDDKYICEYAEFILANIDELQHNSVTILLDLITRHNISTTIFMPWLNQIIPRADESLKRVILHQSYFIFKERKQKEKYSVIEIIKLSIEGIVENPLLDMVHFVLSEALKWKLPHNRMQIIYKRLIQIIKDISKIDYSTDELMAIAIKGNIDNFIKIIEHRLEKYRTLSNNKANIRFDPIPVKGFRSTQGMIKNYEEFSKLMAQVHVWRSKELLYWFDIKHLLENIDGHDEGHGEYLSYYINEKINNDNANDLQIAVDALFALSFNNSTADTYLNLLVTAEKLGMLQETKRLFSNQVVNESYSATMGKTPPALKNRKETLLAMHKKCPPGIISNYIESMIKSIDSNIQHHMDESEELMLPK